LFGIWVGGVPPQYGGDALTFTCGLAEFCKIILVSVICRESCGLADHSSATAPTTWALLIEVPESEL
jgi:hypothetical protein